MSGERDENKAMETAEGAAHWFARLQGDAATAEDWLAFETWFGASPDHAEAYEHLERIWLDLDELSEGVSAALDAPVSLNAHRAARRGRDLTRRGWLVIGAGLAASVAVGVVGVANWPSAPAVSYATANGETQRLILADGSKVWLNAASRIEVRFERRTRRIEMAEGEAVFDVTHDPDRPFLIDAGDQEVRVVGTEFNVRQRGEQFALTVRRGAVEVRPANASAVAPTRVVAGQRLTHQRGARSATLSAADPTATFAWTRGQLVYVDAVLSEVAADLSRSLGTPVRLADSATGRIRFTGVLVLDDQSAVLRHLEAFAPVRAEQRKTEILLRRR